MAAIVFVFVFSLLLLLSAAALGFTRTDFPPDFVFGAATSSYQVLHAIQLFVSLQLIKLSRIWTVYCCSFNLYLSLCFFNFWG